MDKPCPLCSERGHGYTKCPRPLLVPASPQRADEPETAWHKRLRSNEYMRLWTQRKHAADPDYRDRANARRAELEKASDASPARTRVRRLRDRRTADLDALRSRPCADCKGTFPVVCMQFDHRPGEAKVEGISRLKNGSHERLLAEIAKCDVVCANCHAIRTAARARENLKPREAAYNQPARAKQRERERPAVSALQDARADGFV